MKRLSFKTRFKHKAHIDITAMIDLVFLLVAFFMVTSSLGEKSSIAINLPTARQTREYSSGNVVVTINSKNKIFINDVHVKENKFLEVINKRKNEFKKSTVVIRGDKKSQYDTIIKVMDYLNQAGISKFTLSAIKSQ